MALVSILRTEKDRFTYHEIAVFIAIYFSQAEYELFVEYFVLPTYANSRANVEKHQYYEIQKPLTNKRKKLKSISHFYNSNAPVKKEILTRVDVKICQPKYCSQL